MTMLKSKRVIFKSSSKFIFYQCFYFFLWFLFHIYLKTFKNVSAKYYPENREKLKIKAHERHLSLLKEQKKKSNNMVVNIRKISQNMKKEKQNKTGWVQKKVLKNDKKNTFYYNHKKVFKFRRFCFFISDSMWENFLLCLCLKSFLSTNQKFEKNKRNFWFLGFASSLFKFKKVSSLAARKFYFQKYKKFFQSGFFHFLSSESSFLKQKNMRLESSNLPINSFFIILQFMYINVYKYLPVKYYNRERLQKNLVKGIKIFLKKKKKNSNNMVVNVTKSLRRWKNTLVE